MKKIKKLIYNMLRNIVLKLITNNLGKIQVTNDKIICYVNNKKLKKYRKGKYLPGYQLFLRGKNGLTEDGLNIYNINQPIYFIINNMDFETALTVMSGKDVNITFLNCKFNREFYISSIGEIVLENNEYCDIARISRKNISFCRIYAETVKFVNDNFINRSPYKTRTNFGMLVDTNNLEIINSNFDIKKDEGVFSIRSKNINIDNSDINCYKPIDIKADEISSIDSIIRSETEVVIDNKNNNYIMGVTSPKIIYNGMDLSKYHSLDPKNMELQNSRITLIEKLREIRDRCININLSKTIEDTSIVKIKTK